MPSKFDITSALHDYSLPDMSEGYTYATAVTGPVELLRILKLRELIKDEVIWGEAIPADIFVFSDEESADRAVTKCGGLPYWQKTEPWPTNSNGVPMVFLGQINFDQSMDLVGTVPGNILTIFGDADEEDDGFYHSLFSVWMKIDDRVSLIDKQPAGVRSFRGVSGHWCRCSQYPNAQPKRGNWHEFSFRGINLYGAIQVPQIQATQISLAPFEVQRNDLENAPGKVIACLSTICPTSTQAWPWVNQRDPIADINYMEFFNVGDLGVIYVSIDDNGRTYLTDSSS